jgi:uncharacterized lipoprotein YddW (UPF0748 family)
VEIAGRVLAKLQWLALAPLLLCHTAVGTADDRVPVAPPVEIRAIWIDAGAIPKTPDAIRALVRTYHAANINLLFPETIARGYAVYESRLLARDPRFADAPDPIPVMIREAHRLGMEVHPWVWVFRAGYTKDRGAILTAHPDWAELGLDGRELSPNGGLWISPVVGPARDFLADLFAELVCKYDIDGLHLDYIRYESESAMSYGYSAPSKALFERQYGFSPVGIPAYGIEQYQWNKFRERQVNTFVQRIALQTRRLKPRVKLSAAVAPEPKSARLDLMQNWVNWVDNKWLDFLTPMSYSTDDTYFTNVVNADLQAVRGRALIAPGIGLNVKLSAAQVAEQISITRQSAAAGQTLFSASYWKRDYEQAVRSAYACPAMLPFIDTKCAIEKLRASGRTSLADSLQRYLDYQAATVPYVPPTPPPFTIREPASATSPAR